MRTTGIIRRVDELGRVVLPVELRRVLNIAIKDPVEIFADEQSIYIRKYQPTDVFTGSTEELIEYKGKKVSKQSIREMANLAGISVSEN